MPNGAEFEAKTMEKWNKKKAVSKKIVIFIRG